MAVATCALGVCGFACVAPFANCDGNPVNGCETNTALSVLHCGRCGSACAPANAVGRCEAGRCSIAGCNMPFSDCDMSVANGCEVNLRTPENCGECGRRCMPPMTMVATCERGLCASICAPGMADCDMNAANGCETSTHTVDNCVTCGNVCEVHPRATPRCGSTGCQNTCLGLFGDCDGNVTNGCERDVSSDASNCGACGFECGLPRANAMCVRGVCAVERCELDFGNCDGVATNGCEVDLTSDNNHCGRCNNRCAAGTSCSGSRCM
jgi:hypothetical protein